jgi:deoxyribonuclease-4
LRIGIHTSTAGALVNAANKAIELGANTFQIFSSSPRMWRFPPLRTSDITNLREVRAKHDLHPLVIHDNYLINLASRDPEIRAKSIRAYREEVTRAVAIGAEYLVAHPGSYRDQSIDDAIYSFADGLAEAVDALEHGGLTLLIENTAGQGAALGSKFEELAKMREQLLPRIRFPVGFCIDTCHSLAAGYDVASEAGLADTVDHLASMLGLKHIPVIHANDSKGALGSRLDRHANIGEGAIGEAGFRRILRHPALREKAFILETPIDQEGDDQRNVDALKRLSQ